MSFNESDLEDFTLKLLEEVGYKSIHGPDIDPESEYPERKDYRETILLQRLKDALERINPSISSSILDAAAEKLMRTTSPSLIESNQQFHRLLIEGIDVERRRDDGTIAYEKTYPIDFSNPLNNEFIAVNQYSIKGDERTRRPDIVLFINGLPLVVIELKNPNNERTDIWSAFNQIENYKKDIPSLFQYNAFIILSDGLNARIGTVSSDKERFMHWRTIEGITDKHTDKMSIEILIRGVVDKKRILDLIRNFIVFEENSRGKKIKKMAAYHQYYATNKAITTTLDATSIDGDRRAGVVWHTQGSGKSLTMVFYAGKIIQHPEMRNPTLVVVTDRNDLDDQLFSTFSSCHELLRQTPQQASSRKELTELLKRASGGVIFTTVGKVFPEEDTRQYPMLSDRRNIIVITDEAHRSQYNFIDGFARHLRDAMPNASYIGFTGTPIELTDRNTRSVFGEYIDIYDIQQAVDDQATVPIYYESRLAHIELPDDAKLLLDQEFEEVSENEEVEIQEKLKHKWAALEALVGSEGRIRLIANDIVNHYEKKQEAIEGKAMIVCMSRRICVELYNEIVKIRPAWAEGSNLEKQINIIMTGSAADPVEWNDHFLSKKGKEELANRFKDPSDPFKIVIVRDMWLTGFDAPCLHTMYVDKPMRGHSLMQSIARVNRVYKDKQGGLVVDYIGLANELKKALRTYIQSGGKGLTTQDLDKVVDKMIEGYDICRGILHNYDYSWWKEASKERKLMGLPNVLNFIYSLKDGQKRFVNATNALSKAFSLAVPREEALEIKDDVGFFQTVKVALQKITGSANTSTNEDFAIRQIISSAIVSDEIVDIFQTLGLNKPDLSILSDEFLAKVQEIPQKNLSAMMLEQLLYKEIRARSRNNLTESRKFSTMLEESITKYEKRAYDTVEFITALIQLAKELREAERRGEKLNLSIEELAFYDALETNDSAVKILGDEVLRNLAIEIAENVKKNKSIDWVMREPARAKMRVAIKRVLRKNGYPPDQQEKAIQTIIEQAELGLS